jgi:hypothetical protein
MKLHVLVIRMTTPGRPINSRHITFIECFFRNSLLLKHSEVEGQIFWQKAGYVENEISRSSVKIQQEEDTVLTYVPKDRTIDKNMLAFSVNQQAKIGLNKTSRFNSLCSVISSRLVINFCLSEFPWILSEIQPHRLFAVFL